MTDLINPVTKRTGPLRKSLNYKGKISGHIEIMNPSENENVAVTITVIDLEKSPHIHYVQTTKVIKSNGFVCFDFEIPKSMGDTNNYWEVILDGEDNFYATIYHFDKDGYRDDSLTYRDVQLITLSMIQEQTH